MDSTVQWLCHTGISVDVKILPDKQISDDARHSASTDQYIDNKHTERRQSDRRKNVDHTELMRSQLIA